MNGPRTHPFQEFQRLNTGDKRGVLVPFANMNVRQIDLSASNLLDDFDVDGDFVFLDRRTTGLLSVRFNSMAMPPFPMGANSGVQGFPYNKLLLEWEAQSGKVAYVWYGYGAQILPPNQDIANIGSIENPVSIETSYGVEYGSATALTAANIENVFAAASNTQGARIAAMSFFTRNINGTANPVPFAGFIASTTAPGAFLDGALLLHTETQSHIQPGHNQGYAALHVPLVVPAGNGIWYRNNNAFNEDTNVVRRVLYTL